MKRLPIWFLLLTSAGACATRTVVDQSQSQVAPSLVVERFLQAVNTRNLETMSRLFGTEDGPFGDGRGREETELRMDALVQILMHDDYRIMSERRVAGASAPSNRISVDMVMLNAITVRDVGFTVVLASSNQWLITLIDVEKITQAA
jgi:hypothetical protein